MESVSLIQFITGTLAVVVVGIIVWRRRRQTD